MTTASPTFVLDLALLEANGVIRRTPPWVDVDAARVRLAQLRTQKQAYDQMEQDRDLLLQYSDILQRSRDAIGYAVCLAVDLARHSPVASPRDRFGDALRTLGDALDLRNRDEAGTRAELLRCFTAAFGAHTGIARLSAGALPPDNASWINALQSAARDVQSLPPQTADDIRQNSWNVWQERLTAFINSGIELPVDIDYLRCRVRNLEPGTIVRPPLTSLQLNDWSDAYIRSNRVGAPADPSAVIPPWFALAVLGVLGFGSGAELESFTTLLFGSKDYDPAKRFLATMTGPAPQKGVLIIRVSAGSITDKWSRPTRQLPALCVTEENFATATRIPWSYFLPRLHGVLFEAEPNEAPALTLSRARAAQVSSRLPNLRVSLLTRALPAGTGAVPQGGFSTTTVAPPDLATAALQAFDVTPPLV